MAAIQAISMVICNAIPIFSEKCYGEHDVIFYEGHGRMGAPESILGVMFREMCTY
jgi:hypothetical protein